MRYWIVFFLSLSFWLTGQESIEDLQRIIAELEVENAVLKAENSSLKAENKNLEAKNANLKTEVEELATTSEEEGKMVDEAVEIAEFFSELEKKISQRLYGALADNRELQKELQETLTNSEQELELIDEAADVADFFIQLEKKIGFENNKLKMLLGQSVEWVLADQHLDTIEKDFFLGQSYSFLDMDKAIYYLERGYENNHLPSVQYLANLYLSKQLPEKCNELYSRSVAEGKEELAVEIAAILENYIQSNAIDSEVSSGEEDSVHSNEESMYSEEETTYTGEEVHTDEEVYTDEETMYIEEESSKDEAVYSDEE